MGCGLVLQRRTQQFCALGHPAEFLSSGLCYVGSAQFKYHDVWRQIFCGISQMVPPYSQSVKTNGGFVLIDRLIKTNINDDSIGFGKRKEKLCRFVSQNIYGPSEQRLSRLPISQIFYKYFESQCGRVGLRLLMQNRQEGFLCTVCIIFFRQGEVLSSPLYTYQEYSIESSTLCHAFRFSPL